MTGLDFDLRSTKLALQRFDTLAQWANDVLRVPRRTAEDDKGEKQNSECLRIGHGAPPRNSLTRIRLLCYDAGSCHGDLMDAGSASIGQRLRAKPSLMRGIQFLQNVSTVPVRKWRMTGQAESGSVHETALSFSTLSHSSLVSSSINSEPHLTDVCIRLPSLILEATLPPMSTAWNFRSAANLPTSRRRQLS